MTDKSHLHVHRIDTITRYNSICAQAVTFLTHYPFDTLETFCADKHLSRRQVQRALSFNNTSWRMLKKAAGG